MLFYAGCPAWATPLRLLDAVKEYGKLPLLRFLLTYPYVADEKLFIKTYKTLNQLADKVTLIIDSGGFALSTPKKQPLNISMLTYAQFLKRYSNLFDFCFAWDSPNADPATNYDYFKRMLAMGLSVTPVWHLGEPLDLLVKYAELSPSGFVIIGGFGMIQSWGARDDAIEAVKVVVDFIKDAVPDIKVHLAGLGLNAKAVSSLTVESADSSFLFSRRFNWELVVDGNRIYRVDGRRPNILESYITALRIIYMLNVAERIEHDGKAFIVRGTGFDP